MTRDLDPNTATVDGSGNTIWRGSFPPGMTVMLKLHVEGVGLLRDDQVLAFELDPQLAMRGLTLIHHGRPALLDGKLLLVNCTHDTVRLGLDSGFSVGRAKLEL